MSMRLRVTLFVLLMGVVSAAPVFAGSTAIGSVAGSLNASVGGQALLPNTTIFSGDQLQVKDGAAVLALDHGSRLSFGRETAAQLVRDERGVAIVLNTGNVSIFRPKDAGAMRVEVGHLTIVPAAGYKSLGEVAIMNGLVVITSKQGTFDVEGGGKVTKVVQGKTVALSARAARAPQTGTSQKLAGGNTGLEAGALAAGGAAAILAGVGISRADDARNAANAADSTASGAVSAANAATSAANAAGSSAVAATSAAAAAGATANAAGCAINNVEIAMGGAGTPTSTFPSPYTPPAGMTCTEYP